MTAFEYILPPKAIARSEYGYDGLGHLEIEVSRLNFIIDRVNDTTPTYLNNNKNSNKNQSNNSNTPIGIQGATAKFIWWGENREKSASVVISPAKGTTTSNSLPRKNNNHTKKRQTPPSSLVQCQNKLRYTIRTSLTLFLDYLRSCEPIEIIVTTSASSLPLGQARLRLPEVLLRKYASGCTFEHKTKIYALYKNAPRTVQHHQHHHHQQKTGEIQLRFRMLFAPSCKPVSALQEQQLTLQRKHDAKELNANSVTHSLLDESKAEKSAPKPLKSDEIVEAMMKLDAKLVAYLAGEDMSSNSERLESLEELQNASSSISQLVGEMVEERFCEQQLDVFKSISAIKLQMEALTLQPEGTKRMELLQSDIRPIFTVECQLSHELIQGIPHSDMFHIMQFESEKFQSLTQCTRFGQESQRDVRISVDDDASSDDELNFGRIHFTVWWREPGTCLNEMLGMGVLDLKELYNASLLEQCKCITINRRGTHLASLYFKISLQLARHTAPDGVQAVEALLKNTSIKQCSGDNGEGEKKGNVPQTSTEKAQSGKATAATEESNSGEYAESFLYLKDTEIQ